MKRLRHDQSVLLLTLVAGLPGSLFSLYFIWTADWRPHVQWTFSLLIVIVWIGFAAGVRERVIRPLQTLSNMLAGLREADYSIRARQARVDDPLGLAMLEANILRDTLREQRLGALEATALLQRVMQEIDVAAFAFDDQDRLRLVNRAGSQLLEAPPDELLGREAPSLGLQACLEADTPATLDLSFQGRMGRWEVKRSTFRQGGVPHQLLVLTDLSRALRQEERQAWKRLIRVLSHEINNSLAPIKSSAESLLSLIGREKRPVDLEEDIQAGLGVIAGRAEALRRFMGSYADLAKLPPPEPDDVDVGQWVRRVAALETRLAVVVHEGPEMTIQADGDQLDQALINLVRNGVDAALETGGKVEVGWRLNGDKLEVWVRDEGPGLPDTTNIFVPFFSTRPGGTGIGLVLSRQIAEGHNGTLDLQNRRDGNGCVARLVLPIDDGNGRLRQLAPGQEDERLR
ncbi:MAG: PAS domain-containing sensor histidine kinase [Gemmatimonadetes bacterium]|uniref:histidine kinase n=1 Tax=Candidatus Kutchimonas denitrificans TaxID=3056748 RepID=A0AAE4Z7V9_9BACT|nr:PAS domain-containing sensor histidine kinase [Gemmatimonadota bacterium]NIR75440.1 PAS domain-containing sensor histidine kinase [Candidatus Kutchimonas denitrificans]NIS01754.1 PAS domain-containing sensor histidine kinase [Gemmatimonadota bacterium]NIT67536.1 PAS domain-containing sensor histidine kinase [Gemmatimonadota bacterium]NIU53399.1 PAS domain-containing sensor histidine kinase [Gemmatimonadota bacterium]